MPRQIPKLEPYRWCRFCNGHGCGACPGERSKAEASRQKSEEEKKTRYAAMSPDQIIGELDSTRDGIRIGSAMLGLNLSAQEIEQQAREQVSKNLELGGHEWPMPQPVFTCDGSDEQMEQMKQLFHIDVLNAALAPGGEGMEGIMQRAQVAMQERQEQSEPTAEVVTPGLNNDRNTSPSTHPVPSLETITVEVYCGYDLIDTVQRKPKVNRQYATVQYRGKRYVATPTERDGIYSISILQE